MNHPPHLPENGLPVTPVSNGDTLRMSEGGQSVISATDDLLGAMIARAKRRVIALAPAFTTRVAEALARQWAILGPQAVSIFLDTDPEVYRFGYGDPDAIECLNWAAEECNGVLRRAPGVRIGMLIVDDETLVFAPAPRLIEAGGQGKEGEPLWNAVRLGSPPPALERDLGQDRDGGKHPVIGTETVSHGDIEKLEDDLKANPPQPFDIVRKMLVYNSHIEFVEVHLEGIRIDRKRISIPSYLLGIADPETQRSLRATFDLMTHQDDEAGKRILEDRKRITRQFLHNVSPYGTVILRKDKPEFEKQMKELEKQMEQFRSSREQRFDEVADKSRSRLIDELLPRIKEKPPQQWLTSSQRCLDPEKALEMLDRALRTAFDKAERQVGNIGLRYLFKGVTHEMLLDEGFREKMRGAFPGLSALYEETTAAPSTQKPGTPAE